LFSESVFIAKFVITFQVQNIIQAENSVSILETTASIPTE